jgi:hypothetical protein
MKFYIEFDKNENLICDYPIAEKFIRTFNYDNGGVGSQNLKFNLHNCLTVSMYYGKNKIKAEFIPEFID